MIRIHGKQLWTLDEAATVMQVNRSVLVALVDYAAPFQMPTVPYEGHRFLDPDDIQIWLRRCTDLVEAQTKPVQTEEEDFSDVLDEKLGR